MTEPQDRNEANALKGAFRQEVGNLGPISVRQTNGRWSLSVRDSQGVNFDEVIAQSNSLMRTGGGDVIFTPEGSEASITVEFRYVGRVAAQDEGGLSSGR